MSKQTYNRDHWPCIKCGEPQCHKTGICWTCRSIECAACKKRLVPSKIQYSLCAECRRTKEVAGEFRLRTVDLSWDSRTLH